MKIDRFYHSVRLLLCKSGRKRAEYIKKHHLFAEVGEGCIWGPWLLPIYPELIKLHNNVRVHKSAVFTTHDMLNFFLAKAYPEADFGGGERLGCIELMDNVYISMNCIVMPNVRIGKNCIISAGSVVTSDIPENTIASGIPAKPTGRFDMFVALRKMSKSQMVKFDHLSLPKDLAQGEWDKFNKRRE